MVLYVVSIELISNNVNGTHLHVLKIFFNILVPLVGSFFQALLLDTYSCYLPLSVVIRYVWKRLVLGYHVPMNLKPRFGEIGIGGVGVNTEQRA